ncbi:MAG: hydantoinase B/oxoprolinase family protein, partial [Thermomicrobiales bacterium]
TVYPVRVEEYALRAESAGAGQQRGGYGLIRAIRTLRNCRLFFLDERHKTQPWGLYGGRAAAANDAYVERADGEIIQLPAKFDALKLAPGDMFVVRTGGGGGWGDPYLREPEKVTRDVVNQLLMVDEARDWYGVVVDETGLLDIAATTSLRAGHQASESWIDRGVAVDAPSPGEFRVLADPPRPWLAVPHVLEAAVAD